MASITFEGPNVTDLNNRIVTTIEISDEAMIAVVQAFCELEGYTPGETGPGLFTINKTIEFWKQKAEYNVKRKAKEAAELTVQSQLDTLNKSIKLKHEEKEGKNEQ